VFAIGSLLRGNPPWNFTEGSAMRIDGIRVHLRAVKDPDTNILPRYASLISRVPTPEAGTSSARRGAGQIPNGMAREF